MQEDVLALDKFSHTLEWLLALQGRYPNLIQFGIIHVEFHNRQRLGQLYGAKDAMAMLTKLTSDLRQKFRKTDLVARLGMDFWILVPYTEPDTVTEKVHTLVELASQAGLGVVSRDVAVFSHQDPVLQEASCCATPESFLLYLKRNRNINRHWQPNPIL